MENTFRPNKRGPLPDYRKDLKVKELREKGLSYSQIAKKLKMQRTMVIYRWNRVVRSYQSYPQGIVARQS